MIDVTVPTRCDRDSIQSSRAALPEFILSTARVTCVAKLSLEREGIDFIEMLDTFAT